MLERKNIQVIDGGANCTFSIFAASPEDFNAIFPEEGQDIEFIEDVFKRLGKRRAIELQKRLWLEPVNKKEACGIHGTLFYQLEYKRKFYPTKRESEMIIAIDNK